MHETSYLKIRKIFYWFFFCAFWIITPLVVFYSLGYKFNNPSKKFVRTGAIVIETFPKDASVYLDGKRMDQVTPVTLREVLPRGYELTLKKDGYYQYQAMPVVSPFKITKVSVVLIPKTGPADKYLFDFNIYRFFVVKQLFGEKIILFTDKGIFLADNDLADTRLICGFDIGSGTAGSMDGLLVTGERIVFWNERSIWAIRIPQPQESIALRADEIYRSSKSIRSVFVGFKDRYLIVCSGLKVEAVDMENPLAVFEIAQLESSEAEVYYDKGRDVLYMRDRIPQLKEFSLFRLELAPILEEKGIDEEIV